MYEKLGITDARGSSQGNLGALFKSKTKTGCASLEVAPDVREKLEKTKWRLMEAAGEGDKRHKYAK